MPRTSKTTAEAQLKSFIGKFELQGARLTDPKKLLGPRQSDSCVAAGVRLTSTKPTSSD